MKNGKRILLWGLLAALLPAAPLSARFHADLEGGRVYTQYNDVRIPGDSGTALSLDEDLGGGRDYFFRFRAGYTFAERHWVSLLAAPLRVEYAGTLDRDVRFAGETFTAGSRVTARYRFDSYRATNRYLFLIGDTVTAGLGATGKIRDASIELRGGAVRARTENTGFVPLVNFHFQWKFLPFMGFLFEGDALAAPQGRAEDLLLALQVFPNDNISLRIGYRMLEGGADNDEVYTFAWFHYALAGVTFSF